MGLSFSGDDEYKSDDTGSRCCCYFCSSNRPALNFNVNAVKNQQDAECSQDTGNADLGEECPGNSGGNNPNREQQECSVTAGSNDKPVKGQEKKVC